MLFIFMVDKVVLPYRALTKEERDKYSAFCDSFNWENADERVWMTTKEEGLRVAEKVRSLGYLVSDVLGVGNPMDGFRDLVNIYSPKFPKNNLIIGQINLWESCGFLGCPVTVYNTVFPNSIVDLDSALELAYKLRENGMGFEFSSSVDELEKMLGEIVKKEEIIRDCLVKSINFSH